MAIQPPPAPPASTLPQQAPPSTPRRSGCFGCSLGCGGCLLAFALVLVLIVGGGWWFFVVQASAAVTAPATLILYNQPVRVNSVPGTPGQSLNEKDTVETGTGGHAGIAFPDGSFMRLASETKVTISKVQLQRTGGVQAVELKQNVGRTFTNVEHLSTGATFTVSGHSVSASVRGTQFEILVRTNGTNRIWVFVGSVIISGKTSTTLNAGEEIDVDASGTFTNRRSNQFDNSDPFPQAQQCSAATSTGNTAGSQQVLMGDSLTGGQTAENDYYSSGGNLTVGLCYPGSLMSVTVTDPNGGQHAKQGAPPLTLTIANGPPGLYRAVVRAVNVPSGGESYAIAFATDLSCSAASVDTSSVVRETLSSSQISTALAESGTSGVVIYVQGVSATSARIVYYSDLSGAQLQWTIDFYAATPHLGAVITQVSLRGLNVHTWFVSNLSSLGGRSISSIPSGFSVDRVYSCAGPNNDNVMVVEGHR